MIYGSPRRYGHAYVSTYLQVTRTTGRKIHGKVINRFASGLKALAKAITIGVSAPISFLVSMDVKISFLTLHKKGEDLSVPSCLR